MISKVLRSAVFYMTGILAIFIVNAQNSFEEKHLEVSLRMIGHQLLIKANDSTSRVLPIIKTNGQYRIEFESELGFQPDELVQVVSETMKSSGFATRYIVEVEQCDTKKVVYSFEIDEQNLQEIIPCIPREQIKQCLSLVFTVLRRPEIATTLTTNNGNNKTEINYLFVIPLSSALIFVLGLGVVLYRKKSTKNHHIIHIGNYQFDQKNDFLILKEQKIELTSKEAELLKLLHFNANTVVKKETLLCEVWADEGNYIGRTLDVFISKLRGKLQADPAIKIVNVRGVGYKLVVG